MVKSLNVNYRANMTCWEWARSADLPQKLSLSNSPGGTPTHLTCVLFGEQSKYFSSVEEKRHIHVLKLLASRKRGDCCCSQTPIERQWKGLLGGITANVANVKTVQSCYNNIQSSEIQMFIFSLNYSDNMHYSQPMMCCYVHPSKSL